MPAPGVARAVTIDARSGEVWIDDHTIGAAVLDDWSIDDLAGGHIFGVTVTILADAAHVHRDLSDDLEWIRALANTHRTELGLPIPTPEEPHHD